MSQRTCARACADTNYCEDYGCPHFDWYRDVGVAADTYRRPLSWYSAFIVLRNRIGNMEYDEREGGAVGYAFFTPVWRMKIADVCGWLAHRPPQTLLRRLSRLGRRIDLSDDEAVPF